MKGVDSFAPFLMMNTFPPFSATKILPSAAMPWQPVSKSCAAGILLQEKALTHALGMERIRQYDSKKGQGDEIIKKPLHKYITLLLV